VSILIGKEKRKRRKTVEVKGEIKARMRGRWIKLDMKVVEKSLRKIYLLSKSEDLGTALLRVRDYHRDDSEAFEEAGFVAKLLQLEASGYIDPPVSFTELYNRIVEELKEE